MIDADDIFVVPSHAQIDRQVIRRPPLILNEGGVDVVVQVHIKCRLTSVVLELLARYFYTNLKPGRSNRYTQQQ